MGTLFGKTVDIRAQPKWNDTGIEVVRGKTYSIRSTGEWIDKDEEYTTDARGFESKNWIFSTTEWLRRESDARWFALICGVDQDDETLMDLGSRFSVVNGELAGTLTAEHSGELTCFANDLPFDSTNENNKGHITFSVELIE